MNKIAIIGSGNSALLFVKALNCFSNFKLICIGSRNLKSAKQISLHHNSKIKISTIDYVINSTEIDTVIVCLPPSLQPKILIKLFKMKKNVICEKPLALDDKSAKKIYKHWIRSKKIGLVNFCYNFIPEFIEVKKIIKKNKLDLHTIKFDWNVSSRVNPSKIFWKNSFNQGGGVLINFGAHILNLFFPKKEKIKLLSKYQFTKINNKIVAVTKSNDLPDTMTNIILKKKFLFNLNFSTISNPTFGMQIQLIGKKGSIILDNFNLKKAMFKFKMKKMYNTSNKININLIKINKQKPKNLIDLYKRTLEYFYYIKKNSIKKYNMSINEGYWNTCLINQLSKLSNK